MSVTDERSHEGSGGRGSAVAEATGIGVVGFVVGLVLATLVAAPLTQGTAAYASVSLVAQYAGGLAVVAFCLSEFGWSLSRLRLRVPTARDLLVVVGGLLVLFGTLELTTSVLELLGQSVGEHSISRTAESNPAVLLPLIPLSILVTGPVEELLYRGVVHTRLAAAFDTAPTVLVASVVFAAVHLPAYYLGAGGSVAASLIVVFVLGAILGALYEYSGNLVVPAVAHGVYNAITFAVSYLEITGGL
ncbi:hypothetical protein BRD05_08515 [Halobacteriales archaeon QS_9_70_65]|nr:MAG: hypothetical protein BRD05_08515 [Halobacteriales archaeon QS_9_70_65]